MTRLLKILLTFYASFLLAGCASICPQRVVYVPRIERIEVAVPVQTPLPADLTDGCHAPDWPQRPLVNEDLAQWIDSAKAVIETCHARQAQIRRLQP
jgi:hypothetical protein